ncbi:MAG: hypothetical protein R3F11_05960 [Verrucomicrobiales bacterium]
MLIAAVDPRLFQMNTSEEAGNGAEGAPEAGEFAYHPDPNPNKVLARRKWWDSVTSQQFENAEGQALPGYHVLFSLVTTTSKTSPAAPSRRPAKSNSGRSRPASSSRSSSPRPSTARSASSRSNTRAQTPGRRCAASARRSGSPPSPRSSR